MVLTSACTTVCAATVCKDIGMQIKLHLLILVQVKNVRGMGNLRICHRLDQIIITDNQPVKVDSVSSFFYFSMMVMLSAELA